jgi:BON domain
MLEALATHVPSPLERVVPTMLSHHARGMGFAPFCCMHTADEQVRTHDLAPNDARVRAQIQEKLKTHGQVDATKIGVVVRDGQILLWGSVASASEREIAGLIAAEVADRTAVINHIQVFRSSQC